MITIEVLYPEFANLFGDSSNMKYLRQTLPEACFIETSFTDVPYFAEHKPDLIYLGAMSEKSQEKILTKLMPYKDRLRELIDADVPMLFTNNAMELLGEYIENEDGTKIPCLGLYKIHAVRDRMHRFNCLARGHFNGTTLIGFKTQFTFAYGDTETMPFFTIDRGTGMNKGTQSEGIHDHNMFATYLVGPFLVLNPDFTKYLLEDVCGIKDVHLAFEDVARAAYERRLAEFMDDKVKF